MPHDLALEDGIPGKPARAAVAIDGVRHGETPLVADLGRCGHHRLRIELAGYQPFEATVTRTVDGWVWGTLVFGDLIGLALDPATGHLYRLLPDQVARSLGGEGVGSLFRTSLGLLYKADTLYVTVVPEPPDPTWESVARLRPGAAPQP